MRRGKSYPSQERSADLWKRFLLLRARTGSGGSASPTLRSLRLFLKATSATHAGGEERAPGMSDLVFLFGVHNHQPVGNFPSVFKKAFRDCYGPFLEAMAAHPGFKFILHFSGPLWEYMESREKDCWAMIKGMVERGQAELLGGAFYEPVLAVIPEE
ncbi:MAG: hypothetical protein FJY81_07320, partial [Candidatus Aminicenantes bacterium]|nr:hypothetical protein [Candidatus Aminicenantes bacterium]